MLQYTTVRPSTYFYIRFSLLMVRSPGFGSIHSNYGALFRLAFTMSPSDDLDLLLQITRWIVLQKARRHPEGLRLLVRTQFQVLFHSPSGVLFAFPSRYLFTIDHITYLALEGGPPRFNQDFTCPDLLDKTKIRLARLCVPGYHCLWPVFPNCSARNANFLPYADSW
jgi:hypothetical protein